MKKPKLRIPIAKCSQKHKTGKDYDRKTAKKEIEAAMQPLLNFISVIGLKGKISYTKEQK